MFNTAIGEESVVEAISDLDVIPLLTVPISNQLKFHPLDADCTRIVCVPACRTTFVVTVCQFCHPPVLGILTVASTVPLLFLICNCLATVDETLKLNP